MSKSEMTAATGGDRVAEREMARQAQRRIESSKADEGTQDQQGDDEGDDERETLAYTCESCGGHTFLVSHAVTQSRELAETLECSCGNAETAVAREAVESRRVERVGRLDAGHHVDWDDAEYAGTEILQEDREETGLDINCDICFKDAVPEQWETEVTSEWSDDEETEYYEVRCADCNHEIEFGYSHANHGGRIWPCESSDFNPRLTFPDERFEENWRRRGWHRPAR